MLFHRFSKDDGDSPPLAVSGADLLAQTGGNLNISRGAARAWSLTSHNLASETERSRWRSIW
jgi:hypothetical protein